jgi:hypothetical protein
MRIQIQLRIVGDDGSVISANEVLHLDKGDDRLEAIGLSFSNFSVTRRGAFEEETLGAWATKTSMAFLVEARQSRLKICQNAPFLLPYSIVSLTCSPCQWRFGMAADAAGM